MSRLLTADTFSSHTEFSLENRKLRNWRRRWFIATCLRYDMSFLFLCLYLADGELGIVGFPHGVVDEGGHQLTDLVQVIGPGFLRDEGAQREGGGC